MRGQVNQGKKIAVSEMVRVGIWAVGRLSQDDREGMEQLYREYYEGANEGDFARDLASEHHKERS